MKLPIVQGIIDRRMLLNYRLDPVTTARLLPEPFRPKIIKGFAIGGICLIRLKNLRPDFLPSMLGVSSENAAHRFAVEWDEAGETREGVFIPRRDTDSCLSVLVGGRIFPGTHRHAFFDVNEVSNHFALSLASADGETKVSVKARIANSLPASSVFGDLQSASAFFESGSIGFSTGQDPSHLDGIALRCHRWEMEPLDVEWVKSSFFDDLTRFPRGSTTFDCGLLMRNIEHEWHAMEPICCDAGAALS